MLYKKRATFYLHEHEITISPFNFQARYINNSMTSLLTHILPGIPLGPKPTTSPLKSISSLAVKNGRHFLSNLKV